MFVTVSPDGRHIAWAGGSNQQVWMEKDDGSEAHALGAPPPQGVTQLTWTHFGLLEDGTFTLSLLSQKGKQIRIGVVGDVQFSVGGVHVASGRFSCGSCEGPVTVYNIHTHTAVHLGDPHFQNGDPALSPDGTRVAYRSRRGVVVQPAAGVPTRLLAGGSCNISWSPDGKTLAFGSTGIATEPARGGPLTVLIAPSRGATCVGNAVPAWSPDSGALAFVRVSSRAGSSRWIQQLAVVDVRSHALRLTARRLGTVTSYAWSRDGKSIFAVFRSGNCGAIRRLAVTTLTGSVVYHGCG